MNLRSLLFLIVFVISPFLGNSQISHGGYPLPWNLPLKPAVKSSDVNTQLFVDMPSFDVEEELRMSQEEESTDLKSGYKFAYKFMTDYTPQNSGLHYLLPDGTNVWRLGIKSSGAQSINLLFSKYRLPQGAKLFIYDRERTQILGSFTSLNNSELNILPTALIESDEVIVEYQQPKNVAFEAELEVGEVNHGYRDFKAAVPLPDNSSFSCMPPVICYQDTTDKYDDIKRSVVLIIINGNTGCTGVLLNNTSEDKRPYLLTASHCLNGQFSIKNANYAQIAGNIVCYFNYDSPQCSPIEPGPIDQTMASTTFRAVNERTDMLLLELKESIPKDYSPYLAGWNISGNYSGMYVGIHHPKYSLKRLNLSDGVEVVTYKINFPLIIFDENAHLKVSRWLKGATSGGSSGSPLFDGNNNVIGALTGGQSSCGSPINDYYYSLASSWESDTDTSQLKCWLDPLATNRLIQKGLDPYFNDVRNEKISFESEKFIILPTAENQLFIQPQINFKKGFLSLYSIDGKKVKTHRLQSDKQYLTLNTLLKGIYIVEIRCDDEVYHYKIMF